MHVEGVEMGVNSKGGGGVDGETVYLEIESRGRRRDSGELVPGKVEVRRTRS